MTTTNDYQNRLLSVAMDRRLPHTRTTILGEATNEINPITGKRYADLDEFERFRRMIQGQYDSVQVNNQAGAYHKALARTVGEQALVCAVFADEKLGYMVTDAASFDRAARYIEQNRPMRHKDFVSYEGINEKILPENNGKPNFDLIKDSHKLMEPFLH